jgi:hypothetical protein
MQAENHEAGKKRLREILVAIGSLDLVLMGAAAGAAALVAIVGLRWIEAPASAGAYAHDLYAYLRTLDHAGVDLILVEAVPASSDWTAIRDRLGRAATRPETP